MHDDEKIEGAGAGRRDFLKRTAVVGGMVWAAPLIQSAPAFAAQTSPPPPTGGQDISFVAFVIENRSSTRYKYEDAGKNTECTFEGGGELNKHFDGYPALQEEWKNTPQGSPTDGRVSLSCTDDKVWTITPSANYRVKWALVKSGSKSMATAFLGPTGTGYPHGQAVQVFQA
ncbi:twin-arginine translocation signal domain-containing protein [Egicoccus halophilus]|uniref:Uncharacterized protein n=1 Tax=Egicoccus halophilus TaxID=1670830 RepID=A0A8J3A9C3_9ACTN|nr:twin-arginine translocation signal domain-containing protein [Egicoccus halophilus]GGI05358.1 hypothetical protein GCM10011354_13700 [Egicoccus halophilus]